MKIKTNFELKPCPFCGGEAQMDANKYNSVKPDDYDAYCDHCMVGFTRETPEKAAVAWNNRNIGN